MIGRFTSTGGFRTVVGRGRLAILVTFVTLTASAASASLPILGASPWGGWAIEIVEPGDVPSILPVRLGITSAGDPAVTYTALDPSTGHYSLWLAERSGLTWSRDVIEPLGITAGVEIQGSAVHMAYIKDGDVYWTKRDGSTVVTEIAYDYEACSVLYAELVVRSDGEPTIIVSDGCSFFSVHRSGGTWTKETIESALVVTPDAVIDSLDRIHVAGWRYNVDQCRYAVRTAPGVWVKETVQGCRASNTIAVDSQNNPHLASLSYADGFVYLHKDATGWHREIIGDVWNQNLRVPINRAYFTSIAVDTDDLPHILYCERPGAPNDPTANTHTKYATKISDGWSYETVDSSGVDPCRGADLKLDSNGRPHVAYLFGGVVHPSIVTEWDVRYVHPVAALVPDL